jgi:ADP-dependent NAD(P)H-hydrate dehydratase / NAD(P)H-hydrate epimerase
MILSAAQMAAAEQAAFAAGESAADLMETAGRAMAGLVRQFHPRPGTCRVFYGKGHNGGDVLVAARHLARAGWRIVLEKTFADSDLAPLTATMLAEISASHPDAPARPLVVLDGLLGLGTTGAPREPVASAIRRINELRRTEAAWVLAADLPSGLTETGPADPCVQADATLAMGFAKKCLVLDEATNFVGRLAIAPLPPLQAPPDADPASILTAADLRDLLPPRSFETHKGQCGRVAILAGSREFPGAARLCSAAAVHAGAGLVTLFVPPEIAPVLAASTIPEVMVRATDDFSELLEKPYDALAIGPGLARSRDAMVRDLLARTQTPCVVDADALNALSLDPSLLKSSPAPRLLTPHPGEMERLFPRQGRTRRRWLEDFLAEYPAATLLLKGARTLIGAANTAPSYNSTGHPGMATGGMGDVLTGVCAALVAQGKTPLDAARLAAWTCGHAAELAVIDGTCSQESLTPTAVLQHLGPAFENLRAAVL